MSNLHDSLPAKAADLEATSHAAMESLGLSSGNFAWLSGKTFHPMTPQRIIPESTLLHDSVSSNVTYYGGRAANSLGRFTPGHIQAYINEPIPEGAMHSSGDTVFAKPFISRILTVHNGLITVDTPTTQPSLTDGPLVVEGYGRNPRFRNTTSYDTQTGVVKVRHGELFSDGHGWSDDRTQQQDILELPEEVVETRLATLTRTMLATTAIFDSIARRKTDRVTWEITETSPFSTEPR